MPGNPQISIKVDTHGPLFTNHDLLVIRSFMREAEEEVAAQASSYVHQYLNSSIKHPTPYYETQITTQRLDDDAVYVHDRGIVYGPWLEGTSSRNQTTRFKGYRSFAKATAKTRADVGRIVLVVMRRYIGRM